MVIVRDRATGCDHGFGFFFFAAPSVPVRAILLYVKLTERVIVRIGVEWLDLIISIDEDSQSGS